jgi:hypothetical protein
LQVIVSVVEGLGGGERSVVSRSSGLLDSSSDDDEESATTTTTTAIHKVKTYKPTRYASDQAATDEVKQSFFFKSSLYD